MFYTPNKIISLLKVSGFSKFGVYQTLFKTPVELKSIDAVKDGYGKGNFVVISGEKINDYNCF